VTTPTAQTNYLIPGTRVSPVDTYQTGTITMFVAPWTRASILLSPPMSIRTLMAMLFVFDVGGQFFDYGLNINHGVHLGGYAAGLIIYMKVVRKWPVSRSFLVWRARNFGARNRW